MPATREPSTTTGKRRPCPCGSGKRYKACHGSDGGVGEVMITRPFEGLAAECELVALREFVPSATAELSLLDGRSVTIGTVLPMAAAGITRADGTVLLGLQTQTRSGDISGNLARAIDWSAQAQPGEVLNVVGPPGDEGRRLQDLVAAETTIEPVLHKDFAWWIPQGVDTGGEVASSIERVNAAIMATERLDGVEGAYWVDAGEKAHLRWVRPQPEEALLAAMARLQVAGALDLGVGSRYAGSFRAHGLLVPVWDLDPQMHAREWQQGVSALSDRLSDALASEGLNAAQRRALQSLRGRQITLR